MQYKHKNPSHCFTIKATGLSRVIMMEIEICEVDNPAKKIRTKAIWDTGATGTVITEGKTTMSFRIPSQHEIDYVKKMQQEKEIVEKHTKSGRSFNSPCICNSGRKFKNCHGKDLEKA